jgi:hypothetical protein
MESVLITTRGCQIVRHNKIILERRGNMLHKSVLVLLMKENFVSHEMLNETITTIGDFCSYAMVILFLCIMIRFVIDMLENGYSLNLLKKMFIQMMILGVLVSPIFYPFVARLYTDIYTIMMNHIGMSQIDNLRDAIEEFYNMVFDNGEAGVINFFFIKIEYTPLNLIVPSLMFMLFLISMYEVIMLPTIFMCIAIAIAPFLLALSPLFKDKLDKFVEIFTGLAFIYPLVLYSMSTFLPVPVSLLGELAMENNTNLLMIFSLAYSIVIAYSLPLIGYISGLSFISEARVIFPITWAEYVLLKPVMFAFNEVTKYIKKKGK